MARHPAPRRLRFARAATAIHDCCATAPPPCLHELILEEGRKERGERAAILEGSAPSTHPSWRIGCFAILEESGGGSAPG
jgi:hypothetical protein